LKRIEKTAKHARMKLAQVALDRTAYVIAIPICHAAEDRSLLPHQASEETNGA
jgi:hypothetical protein